MQGFFEYEKNVKKSLQSKTIPGAVYFKYLQKLGYKACFFSSLFSWTFSILMSTTVVVVAVVHALVVRLGCRVDPHLLPCPDDLAHHVHDASRVLFLALVHAPFLSSSL